MELNETEYIRIEWKEEINTTASLMKSIWSKYDYVFSNSRFKELIENYDSEPTEEYLKAIGQEFSTHDLLLYNINEDSDSYCLTVIQNAEKEDYEKFQSENKVIIELQKQKRKKLGTPAKRIKLSKQIPYQIQQIKGDFRLKYPLSVLINRTFTKQGAFKESKYELINTTDWQFESFPTESLYYTAFSKNNEFCCAIFMNDDKKNGSVKICKKPFSLNTWHEVNCDEEIPMLAMPFWIKEDLLIIHKKVVWLVSSATAGNRECIRLIEVNTPQKHTRGEFPKVFETLNGQTYILLNFVFYKWENKKLINTGLSTLEHVDFDVFPTGNHRIVYISMGEMVEVDFRTKKTRKRRLKFMDAKTTIQKYSEDWAVLKRYGTTNKSTDIAQFWNPKSDTLLRMPLGKIGKFGIRQIILHPEGYTIINPGNDIVIRINNLIENLKSESKLIGQLDEWSEIWKRESETTMDKSDNGFLGLMKRILGK